MALSIICNNKGCGKLQNPYLDKETNLVYCSMCDGEIPNVTVFVKNQMKMNKQFRTRKDKKPFSLKCELCKAESQAKLIDDEVVCGSCLKPLANLTPFYVQMLKTQLIRIEQEKAQDDNE